MWNLAASEPLLHAIDWGVIGLYIVLIFGIGIYFLRTRIAETDDMLVAGRQLPWWVIGFCNVSSYSDGGGAWILLMFLGGFMYLHEVFWIAWPIWMPLVAVFWAKFWRRSGLVTTGQLLEFRYGGRPASIFRGCYALYACLIWAVVFLAYGSVFLSQIIWPILPMSPLAILVIFGGITLLCTVLSGLYAVAYTSVLQFAIFFAGAFFVIWLGFAAEGGYAAVLGQAVDNRPEGFWQILPPAPAGSAHVDPMSLVALLIIGLALPGSPSAGEGWTAQRFLAAKDERHAALGQMFNCILTLVVRMIPPILLGILAVGVLPAVGEDFSQLQTKDGSTDPAVEAWGHLVLTYGTQVPGVLGLLMAGALAGYMSSVDTFLNWGAGFVINDLYRRHLRPDATDRECLWATRIVMVVVLVLAICLTAVIENIVPWVVFINMAMIVPILPLAWLRWFWWRTNIWAEIFGIVMSAPLAFFIWFGLEWQTPLWQPMFILLGAGLAISVVFSLILGPEDDATLRRFYTKVRPPGFWGPIRRPLIEEGRIDASMGRREFRWDIAASLAGIAFCFAMLFAFINAIMLQWGLATILTIATVVTGYAFYAFWLRSQRIAAQAEAGIQAWQSAESSSTNEGSDAAHSHAHSQH